MARRITATLTLSTYELHLYNPSTNEVTVTTVTTTSNAKAFPISQECKLVFKKEIARKKMKISLPTELVLTETDAYTWFNAKEPAITRNIVYNRFRYSVYDPETKTFKEYTEACYIPPKQRLKQLNRLRTVINITYDEVGYKFKIPVKVLIYLQESDNKLKLLTESEESNDNKNDPE